MSDGGRHDWIAARVAQLAQVFGAIERERMHDVPVLNRALAVEAIGFEPHDDVRDGEERPREGALGVLLTPWFMNLVWLPKETDAALANEVRTLGSDRLSFMVANEAGIGPYQMCSLFSPVFEFESQEAARATALEVLRILRTEPEPPPPPPTVEAPSRRAFLTGRLGGSGA